MTHVSNINWDKFNELVRVLMEYYTKLHRFPISADNWEELAWASLAFMYGENKVLWTPRSHERSVDIRVTINNKTLNLSSKSGEIKDNTLTLSSYRLTRFGNNLAEKLNFIRDEHERRIDWYLFCAREERVNHIYYAVWKVKPLELAPEDMVNPSNWVETEKIWCLEPNVASKLGFKKVEIRKKMSDQLWYDIPLTAPFLKKLVEITIPRTEVGKGFIKYLRERFPQSP